MKSTRWLNDILHRAGIIDDGALAFMTLVDMALAIVFFVSFSIDTLTTIGLVILGVLIPLVKVRFWIKRKYPAAIVWAIITFFAGVNFMLTTVTIQQDDKKEPSYIIDARSALKADNDNLSSLQSQYNDHMAKNERTTADHIADQIKAEQQVINADRITLNLDLDRFNNESMKIKALSVFDRFPRIISGLTPGIAIATLFFILIFGGIEWTIFAISREVNQEIKRGRGRPKGSKNKKKIEQIEEMFV